MERGDACRTHPRPKAGSGRGWGEPWGREGGRGVGQSLLGGRRPGRQGQHLLMPRRVTQGDTQQAHGGGRLQEILFFSAFLYFTNSLPPKRLFCNQKKSFAETRPCVIILVSLACYNAREIRKTEDRILRTGLNKHYALPRAVHLVPNKIREHLQQKREEIDFHRQLVMSTCVHNKVSLI